MDYKGNASLEELSSFLRGESPRCVVIVAAAFFDETLGRLLGGAAGKRFGARIDEAFDWDLLTRDEYHDMHVLRGLRNEFAHDLRVKDFDARSSSKAAGLKIWATASRSLPLDRVIRSPLDQLLFVVGVIGFRLQRRTKPSAKTAPPDDPPIRDLDAWPPVTDF